MRNISFKLTTEQVRNQTKTVTRRLGWGWLNAGTLLQPVVQGQGIPKGGKVQKIGCPIRVVSVQREPLLAIERAHVTGFGNPETVSEGFPAMSGFEFVLMFCQHNACFRNSIVTRIEFEYTEPRA